MSNVQKVIPDKVALQIIGLMATIDTDNDAVYGDDTNLGTQEQMINSINDILKEFIKSENLPVCGKLRPPRDVLCQKNSKHGGRHQAIIFWE